MHHFIKRLLFVLFGMTLAGAALGAPLGPDPCSTFKKTTVAINITAAGWTTLYNRPATNPVLYICHISMNVQPSATTAASAELCVGNASCVTPLIGPIGNGNTAGDDATPYSAGDGTGTVVSSSASGFNVGILAAGTTVQISGTMSYVAQ